jgi:hypothetical protein
MDRDGFTFNLVTQRFLKNRWNTEIGKKVLEEVIEGLKNAVEVRAILDDYVLDHPENQDPYGHPYYPKSEMDENSFWVLTHDDLRGIHVYNETFPKNSSFTVKSLNYTRFFGCNFSGTNMERTELSMATFEKCNLKAVCFAYGGGFGTRFIDSNLKNVCYWGSGLIDGDISGSDLRGIYLEDAKLENITVNYSTKLDLSPNLHWKTRNMPVDQIADHLKAYRVAYEKAEIWHNVDQYLSLERAANRKHILYPQLKEEFSVRGLYRWVSDLLWGYGTGYGTKPSRLILSGFVVSILYSIFFYVAGNPGENQGFVSSLYFSFTTFATLGYGDLSYGADRWVLRLISTSEAWAGAVLIAAYVGVLGRKVIRH